MVKARVPGSEGSEIERLVRGVEDALHVNATACWQQGVCSMVRGSRDNTSTAGLAKVLDGLSRSGGFTFFMTLDSFCFSNFSGLSCKKNV